MYARLVLNPEDIFLYLKMLKPYKLSVYKALPAVGTATLTGTSEKASNSNGLQTQAVSIYLKNL